MVEGGDTDADAADARGVLAGPLAPLTSAAIELDVLVKLLCTVVALGIELLLRLLERLIWWSIFEFDPFAVSGLGDCVHDDLVVLRDSMCLAS